MSEATAVGISAGGRQVAIWRPLAGPFLLALIPAIPLCFTLLAAFGDSVNFEHIASVLLLDMVTTTILLVGISALLATILGTGLAWLISAFDFYGRGVFSWALALPLALPAYVSAYAWGDITGVRGLGVAILVYVTTLYPYVYLAARGAFEAQSVCALEAARMLGASAWRRLSAIALPMARPAIAAGAALAALEMTSDYGAADHLGVQTLTIGIFRAWFSFSDLPAAARLSCFLLIGVLALVWLERYCRAGSVAGGSRRWRTPTRAGLSGVSNLGASVICASSMTIAFAVPVGHLAALALDNGPPRGDFWEPWAATALLCLLGAVTTLVLATAGAFVARAGRFKASVVQMSALAGYATPGAVLALGILAAYATLGQGAAVALTGPLAIVGLCYAYAARFVAAGMEPLSAGLEKATPSMREAARTLGASPMAGFIRVDAPLAAPSAFAAALIVAVEIAKELPATTILRPFGFDTLAINAHAYASDERLAAAAWPALAIVMLALVPTLIFSHGLSKARAGQK